MKILRHVEICLVIAIWHQIGSGVRLIPTNATDNTLKYSTFAYSAFSALQFTDNSTLIFRFKTVKKHGMLFYMDDRGIKEFIDAFLLNGQLRVRLTMGSCREKQRIINGSFTDLNWHKITLKRTSEAVTLAVDGHNNSYKLCNRVRKTDFKKHGPLYVSYFPSEEWSHPIKWSFRDSWLMSMKHGGFEGCIKTPKYAVGNRKFRRARLLKTERTVSGCRDACKDSSLRGKCYNGGKCVNRIVRRKCDCRGTGYHGLNCSQVAFVDSMAGLRFSGQSPEGSFAEFTGWSMIESSELQFYFKTAVRKPALLLYQGTGVHEGRSVNDYIEVSLLANGNVRLQLVGNTCSPFQVAISRNFTDNSWHKLTISRRDAQLSFSVDNFSAPVITCAEPPRLSGLNGKAKKSLFIGGIPFQDSRGDPTFGTWSLTGLLNKIVEENSWFRGCIALLRYSSASKQFENVKLLKSHGVYGNCSGEACSSGPNMCQHGGQCVDLVTRTECDCEGTGYYGRYCEKSDNTNSTAAIGENATLTSIGPDPTRPFKSDPNNSNNDNNNNNNGKTGGSGSPTAKEKKDPHHSSSPVSYPGWCLLLSVTTLFMRSVACS